MQVGNGSGLVGVKVGGTWTTIGVKYAVPNSGEYFLFWDPNASATPFNVEGNDVHWDAGIPGSPTNVAEARAEAKTLFGTDPDEGIGNSSLTMY